MALNWANLTPNRTPNPLPRETTITAVESGAELSLTIPDAPPISSAPSGGSGGLRKLREKGGIWLTDQRLIFTTPSSGSKLSFESLSIPLHSILSTKFQQPLLGGNYLAFEIKPTPSGGLTDGTHAELRFSDRAMFVFVSLLEKTREKAIYMKRQETEEDAEGLPTYTSPPAMASTSVLAGITVDNPPGYDA